MIRLLGTTKIEGKEVTMEMSDGVVQKAVYGLPDDWYGGMVKEFRKIKGSNILMCIGKRESIINLAIDDTYDFSYDESNVIDEDLVQEENPEEGEELPEEETEEVKPKRTTRKK